MRNAPRLGLPRGSCRGIHHQVWKANVIEVWGTSAEGFNNYKGKQSGWALVNGAPVGRVKGLMSKCSLE